jgi:hypothetical protein
VREADEISFPLDGRYRQLRLCEFPHQPTGKRCVKVHCSNFTKRTLVDENDVSLSGDPIGAVGATDRLMRESPLLGVTIFTVCHVTSAERHSDYGLTPDPCWRSGSVLESYGPPQDIGTSIGAYRGALQRCAVVLSGMRRSLTTVGGTSVPLTRYRSTVCAEERLVQRLRR